MEAVWILVVIFTFIIVISTLDNKHDLKKKKIEAALRMREMEQGIKPGTYSNLKTKNRGNRRNRKKDKAGEEDTASSEAWERQRNREQLKKGIEDLQQRLDNLETIMESRKEHSAGPDKGI